MSETKSLRLNKDHRRSILESFIAKWVEANPKPEEFITSDEVGNSMAQRLFIKAYSHIDTSSIPKEFLNTKVSIKAQLPNYDIVDFYYGFNEDSQRITMLGTKESKVEVSLSLDSQEWLAYTAQKETFRLETKKIRGWEGSLDKFSGEVNQVLQGINTTGQLLELWPESAPFLPTQIINPSSINLPAISIKQLTDQIK